MTEPRTIPIIFQPAMVAALLRELERPGSGKTMTRRLLYTERRSSNGVIPASDTFSREYLPPHALLEIGSYWSLSGWQNVKPGDRLWVRERHWRWGMWDYQPDGKRKWSFLTDRRSPADSISFDDDLVRWEARERSPSLLAWWQRPSIFLPLELSRLTLIVKAVKIERLKAISERDSLLEGVERTDRYFGARGPGGGWLGASFATAGAAFGALWMSIHGAQSWDANPWVVAIEFSVHRANVLTMKEAA